MTAKECLYEGCTRPAERGGYCHPHQPEFVERCARGEHDQCYEDGLRCCTCNAKRPYWREIAPNTYVPAVGR